MDVLLRAVPSISIYLNPGTWNIGIRNRSNANSSPILFMINSHPINEVYSGGASWVHDIMNVDNIKRIEVLRSPGSAVYGANAFVGAVNIITKEAEDINGFELTARGGSWDTQQYNLLFGDTFQDLEVALNFNYFNTRGFRGFIEEDAQTQIDKILVPSGFAPASLAPGRMAGDDEKYDFQLTLKYKGLKFDGKYVDREFELPIGWATALNQNSIANPEDYYLNLSYETNPLAGLDFVVKVYRNLWKGVGNYQVFPPGFVVGIPSPPFVAVMPDGLIIAASLKASRTGAGIQTTYKISDSNILVCGVTYEEQRLYDTTSGGNFLPTSNPNAIIPLPAVTIWPDNLQEDSQKRNFKAIFMEDIWDITDALRLTIGARYDHYSDFGSVFNPRFGLTWEFLEGYDLKLLYGEAFREPSFFELESELTGIDLEPEEIDTYELSIGADFTASLSSRVTFYYRELENTIIATSAAAPWNYTNFSGKDRDHGFEIEARYDFGKGTYLAAHYNYSSFNNWAKVHSGTVMSNIRLSRYLNLYTDCQFREGEERWAPGDRRDDPSGYTIVNTTLIARKFLKGYEGIELRGSVYNLFDKDYTTPSGPELPNDVPMPGINFLFEIRYTY